MDWWLSMHSIQIRMEILLQHLMAPMILLLPLRHMMIIIVCLVILCRCNLLNIPLPQWLGCHILFQWLIQECLHIHVFLQLILHKHAPHLRHHQPAPMCWLHLHFQFVLGSHMNNKILSMIQVYMTRERNHALLLQVPQRHIPRAMQMHQVH